MMKIRLQKNILLIIACMITCMSDGAPKNQQSQLDHINQNILSMQSAIQKATVKRSHLQRLLAQIEISESHMTKQLRITKQNVVRHRNKLWGLERKSNTLKAASDRAHRQLKNQIQSAYILSQQPYLKVLLAPNHVAQTQRILMYFHYIAQAQIQSMQGLQQSLSAFEKNQQAMQIQYKKLLALQQSQLQTQAHLQQTKSKRQELVHIMDQRIRTKHQKLVALVNNKKELQQAIEQLRQEAIEAKRKRETQQQGVEIFSHAITIPHKPFSQLRGQLSWPTTGHIADHFDKQIDDSELHWDGVLITAPLGQPIRAIAPGRVIFSKWMSGYGLLLIVHQGQGYMSIYARAQTFSVNVGDTVRANQIIGTVGQSGGFSKPALYFSIRHNGVPLNPSDWCR